MKTQELRVGQRICAFCNEEQLCVTVLGAALCLPCLQDITTVLEQHHRSLMDNTRLQTELQALKDSYASSSHT